MRLIFFCWYRIYLCDTQMSKKEFTNISVDLDTYSRLRKHSQGPPDSFNTIVKALMDFKERHSTCLLTNIERQKVAGEAALKQ